MTSTSAFTLGRDPTTSSDPFSSTSFHDGTELQLGVACGGQGVRWIRPWKFLLGLSCLIITTGVRSVVVVVVAVVAVAVAVAVVVLEVEVVAVVVVVVVVAFAVVVVVVVSGVLDSEIF